MKKENVHLWVRAVSLAMAMVLMLLTLAGCGGSGSSSKEKDTNTLVVGLSSEPDKLDPENTTSMYARQVNSVIYDNLLTKDENGEYVGDLAEEYTVSEDGLVYTFQLRKGVKFHNGEELKASDVVFTFTRGQENAASQFFYDSVDHAEATDEYTAVITLKYPFISFKEILTQPQTGILNEKAVTEGGEDYARNPVGTGAYQFENWNSGQSITFKSFDDCWSGKPAIPNLEFRIVNDQSTAMISLEKGEIDIYYNLSATYRESVEETGTLAFEEAPAESYNHLVLNLEDPYLSDVNVRKAISYAVDKASVLKVGADDSGVIAETQMSPAMYCYPEGFKGYEYDIEKAKACLAESAYPDGFSCKLNVTTGASEKMGTVIQANLAEIGIDVQLNILEFSALSDGCHTGNFTMAILGRSYHMQDPTLGLNNNFNSQFIGRSGNYARYSNEQVDAWFAETFVETDEAKRVELFNNILTALKDDAVNVPFFWKMDTLVYNKNLKNISIEGKP
ncbi:MAG: ABC transporter substrate-binding protein [Ruminiclostridium sp.]|nr:ABC transporter substrate-binding protein [Ruminiclostridium sp.]